MRDLRMDVEAWVVRRVSKKLGRFAGMGKYLAITSNGFIVGLFNK